MADIFLKIVNMSISASWIVLAVLLLRLLLKKAPKWINGILWGIVGLRLIMPFSLESVFSLIPSGETISKAPDAPRPHFESGVTIIDNQVNDYLGGHYYEGVTRPTGHFADITTILAVVWIVGIVVLLAYTIISYLKVKNKIGTAVLLRDNIYQSENVVSPFVLGIIKPKIYLPFNMNEQDMEHVIAHENAHIHRKDHWWKPFGFLVLTLHWFNPLMWLGYVLLCRDIELACDEKVVKEFNNEQKADYSQALLTCSVNRRIIAACPLAFGEVGVKDRVKSVLNYKKPAFWVIIVAIITSIAVAVCFLTNPKTSIDEDLSLFLDMQIADHNYSKGNTDDNFIAVNSKILEVDKSANKTIVYLWAMYHEYSCENGIIKLEAASHVPTVITAKQEGKHGHYELVEYWVPHDGSLYEGDIKSKFPLHLHAKALNSQLYDEEQRAFCENAAKEYYSVSEIGGADNPTNTIIFVDSKQLKEKYPKFFNVSTDGGLTVYIWQMSKDNYSCYLANTSMEAISDNSFAYDVGATIAEMRAILTTYDIDRKDITVQPIINPLSSYYYEIDDAYRAKVKELFWKYSYNVIDYDGSSIPKLNVTCGNASTEASMGTTEWTSDAGNGTMQTINGDSSHPLERIDYLLPLALKVNRSNNATPVVGLNFNVAPDSIMVNSWFLTENGKTKSFDAEVDGFNIKLNAGKETCVYEVVATWNKSAKYYGTVRYSFCVVESDEINAQASSSYDEWGLKMDILFKSATEFDAVFNHDSSKMTVKGSLTTDPEFEIKAIDNGKVISFGDYMRNVLHYDYADPEFAWDTVLYTIAQNKETSIDQYLLGTYGNLPVGQYLLCKKVTLTTASGDRKTKVYTADFAITD